MNINIIYDDIGRTKCISTPKWMRARIQRSNKIFNKFFEKINSRSFNFV